MGLCKTVSLEENLIKEGSIITKAYKAPTYIYNPITTLEFSAIFTSYLQKILRGKHCLRPITIMGAVDTLGQVQSMSIMQAKFEFSKKATKIWQNLSVFLDIIVTSIYHWGDFGKFFWPVLLRKHELYQYLGSYDHIVLQTSSFFMTEIYYHMIWNMYFMR